MLAKDSEEVKNSIEGETSDLLIDAGLQDLEMRRRGAVCLLAGGAGAD